MEAYKPYIDYITNAGVAQTAYVLSKEGAICATNLPIQQLPQYNFNFEDQNGKVEQIIVDERVNLLEAIANKGVCKHKQGIRLYNQKYYTVNCHEGQKGFPCFYLKKEKGGACICVTKNFILIGTFSTSLKMQNGVPQNPGELNKRVESLAQDLVSKGY